MSKFDPRHLDPDMLKGGQKSKAEGFSGFEEKTEDHTPPQGTGVDEGGLNEHEKDLLEKATVHELRSEARRQGFKGAHILTLSKEGLLELLRSGKMPQPKQEQQEKKEEKQQGDELLEAILAKRLSPLLDAKTDEKQVRDMIQTELANHKVGVTIKVAEKPEVNLEGEYLHPAFKQALELAIVNRQVLLVGDAGTGKTTLAKQLAKALNLIFAHISCSAGMSEGHLLGRMLINGDYAPAEFVQCYENGGLFLADEYDAMDANTSVVINSALANGRMSIPNRLKQPFAERHKDFIFVGAGNTFGKGSNEYHGRNYQDAAFLDRFSVSKVFVDYDTTLEGNFTKECPELANKLWDIRAKVKAQKLRRCISTRAFVQGASLAKYGWKQREIIETLVRDWTPEERAKVGI